MSHCVWADPMERNFSSWFCCLFISLLVYATCGSKWVVICCGLKVVTRCFGLEPLRKGSGVGQGQLLPVTGPGSLSRTTKLTVVVSSL